MIDPTLRRTIALPPSVDTTISSSGGNPQGVSTILVGTRRNGILDRGLIRFDMSSLPPNANILSALLQLSVVRVSRFPVASTFSLYRLFTHWGSDANWLNSTAGVPWSAPGASPPSDYDSTASVSVFLNPVGGQFNFGPAPAL